MTVDTKRERISHLSIDSLPAWTEAELGAWIRLPSLQGGPTENDVSSICWAMGSYWDLAVKRAKCWAKCQDAFPHLFADLPVRTGLRAEEAPTTGSDDDEDAAAVESSKVQPKPQKIRPHLGRRTLAMRKDGVLLEIRWTVSFDWTGEAESEVCVDYDCPQSCKYYSGCLPSTLLIWLV